MSGKMDRIRLRVEGMHCSACELRLERELQSLPGVIKATASLPASSVTVEYDSSRVGPEEIRAAVGRAGYRAETLRPPRMLVRSSRLRSSRTLPGQW